jgi:D-3-phosphoglycerate dehydrogenase
MYKIWSERAFPTQYEPLLKDIAVIAGSASDTPETPFAALPGAHAIIASAKLHYDGVLMDQSPSLLVISRTGIGVDKVTPDAPTISTAEMAISLLLAVTRDIMRVNRDLKKGTRTDFFNTYRGLEVYGLNLGLIGCGRIGSRVAKMALGMDMNVTAFDPFLPEDRAVELGIELAPTLEELLGSADIVSLHLPATTETHHFMNSERLAQMKAGSILINTSRGSLVDETALLEMLDGGHLWGAGLDVLQEEPPNPDHPLLNHESVIVTPHIASATGACKDRLWQMAITQALQVLRGEQPPNIVNKEVWSNRRSLTQVTDQE